MIVILIALLLVLSLSLLLFVILYRRMKFRHHNENYSKEMYVRELALTYNKDEMEVDPSYIRLYEKLGEGAFGIVRKGVLFPQKQDVAVKMLKGNFIQQSKMKSKYNRIFSVYII